MYELTTIHLLVFLSNPWPAQESLSRSFLHIDNLILTSFSDDIDGIVMIVITVMTCVHSEEAISSSKTHALTLTHLLYPAVNTAIE